MRRLLATLLFTLALPAAAQVVPTRDYSDIWYNAAESGWGVTFTQHASNQVFAVWYTYDPRIMEATSAGNYKPLWIVMSGGSWTTPTSVTGDAYVTLGTPWAQPWNTGGLGITRVGTFTFTFSGADAGTFSYNISPPSGLTSGSPAFGLAAFSGSKAITRQSF
jgi:lysyl endopeptidase